MKHICYKIMLMLLIIPLAWSCSKEGPEGPKGPDGPPGNPGYGSGSGGSGIVKAYTYEGKMLKWKEENGWYYLIDNEYTFPGDSYNFTLPDSAVQDNDAVLIYLELKTSNSATWMEVPFTFYRQAEPVVIDSYEIYDGFIETFYQFKVAARVTYSETTGSPEPYYDVNAVKAIVIPASVTGAIGSLATNADSNKMTLREVMKKYHIEDKDFKQIKSIN